MKKGVVCQHFRLKCCIVGIIRESQRRIQYRT
jgi:hypothetical protein